MNVKKIIAAAIAGTFLLTGSVYAQPETAGQGTSSAAFVQGADAFRRGEWMSAVFLLRKAVSYPDNSNAETWYMLITAEMYAGEYKSAFNDCEMYLQQFPDSTYISYVCYHKGRALFCLGEYEKSVLLLSDFCHQYPDHEMYASALFWIAESFYAGFNYNEAHGLYARIVNDFSSDSKAPAAQYRIETIAQRSREEKLLYLLKETGEEYLSAKEEYEKQLRLSGAEGTMDVRRRLVELQRRNTELEKQVSELIQEKENLVILLENEKKRSAVESDDSKGSFNYNMIKELKEKAKLMQEMIDDNEAEGKSK